MNHAQGQGVTVAHFPCRANRVLFPPLLVARVVDEDEDRAKEEDADDEEGC